jgi:hypothetical protein
VEECRVVENLDIAGLKLDDEPVPDGREVHRVDGFSLLLGHGGYLVVMRRGQRTGQGPPRIAKTRVMLAEVGQERPAIPAYLGVVEAVKKKGVGSC